MVSLAIPLALQLGLGYGAGTDFGKNTHPGIPLRAGLELAVTDSFAVGLSVLDVPGSKPAQTSCASPCSGNGSFAGIAGYATMLWSFDWLFLEGGLGVGHLITLSGSDLFENPALHGTGAFAWMFGGGARYDAGEHVGIGVQALLVSWSGVVQDAHPSGVTTIQAQPDISVVGAFVMATIWFSP